MTELLVRVGIDSTDGEWNAPVRVESGKFAYITITDVGKPRPGLRMNFDEHSPALAQFKEELPEALLGKPSHLDPDFEHLTYGDTRERAKQIGKLGNGDVLVFFAGLRPQDAHCDPLFYAIIGLYVIETIVPAVGVPKAEWHKNAHSRNHPGKGEIIVTARPGVSGRLKKCIPIGEYRNRAYRVREDLLTAWGGLRVKNGYIQRSARLPVFEDAACFYGWFRAQKPKLVAENNPV